MTILLSVVVDLARIVSTWPAYIIYYYWDNISLTWLLFRKNIKYIIIDAVGWRWLVAKPIPVFSRDNFYKRVEPSSDNSLIEIYLEKKFKIILKWEKKEHSSSSCLHNFKAITCPMNRYLQQEKLNINSNILT